MLKSLFNPKQYVGGIPCDSPVPLSLKDLTIYSVIKPNVDVNTTGFLIWNTLRGCYSVTLSGFPTGIAIGNSAFFVSASFPVTTTLSPFPYQNSAAMLNIKPDLTDTMSLGRLSAGSITVYSATTSTTLAAINGELSGTSVTDLRNCVSFSVPDLIQAASCVKDGTCNIRPAVGVTAIVGPDVGPDVSMIDYDKGINHGGDGFITSQPYVVPAQGSAGVGIIPCVFGAPSFNFSGASYSRTFMGNYWGDFVPQGVDIRISLEITTPGSAGTQASIGCCAEVGFATIDVAGVATTRKVMVAMPGINGGGLGVVFNDGITYTYTSDIIKTSFGEQLAYVVPMVINFAPCPTYTVKMKICLNDVYGRSGFGSYRVIRWDNVDPTQTINIKGCFMVEGVPAGSIAPFVKGDHKMITQDTGHVLSYLRSIFSNPSVFTRRIFRSNAEAENYTGHEAEKASALMAAGMYSAGMYAGGLADAGKAIGNIVGDVAGTGLSLLGSGVEDAIGGLFSAGARKRLRDY